MARLEQLLREARAHSSVSVPADAESAGGVCRGHLPRRASSAELIKESLIAACGEIGVDGRHEEEEGAGVERCDGGSSLEAGDLARQLNRALEREREVRALATRERLELNEQMQASRCAQDKAMQEAKMQLKLKDAYIAHLERKGGVPLAERELDLRKENESLRRQLAHHPQVLSVSAPTQQRLRRVLSLPIHLCVHATSPGGGDVAAAQGGRRAPGRA